MCMDTVKYVSKLAPKYSKTYLRQFGGPLGPGGDIVTFGDDLGTRWGDLGQLGDALECSRRILG